MQHACCIAGTHDTYLPPTHPWSLLPCNLYIDVILPPICGTCILNASIPTFPLAIPEAAFSLGGFLPPLLAEGAGSFDDGCGGSELEAELLLDSD